MDKKSILVYHDWLTDYEDLTNEEFGELVRALLKFDINGETTKFSDKTMKLAYKQTKRIISNNRTKYENKCKRNQENINKRYERIQSNTNVDDKDKVKVKDKEKVKEKDKVCSVTTQEENTRTLAYQLGHQILYQDEVDDLKNKYGENAVEDTIKRIMDKPYFSCLDCDHISQWCEELRENASKFEVKGYQKRTDTDYKELERRLFNK